ncbi:MAG: Mobile element protein, partial [uncultured Chloroflexia bacterium]
RPWPSYVASARSRPPAARPAGTGSTAAATDRPMPPSTAWSSCACAPTSPPSTTSSDAPPRERASPRSSVASNASWPARSLAISVARQTLNAQHQRCL